MGKHHGRRGQRTSILIVPAVLAGVLAPLAALGARALAPPPPRSDAMPAGLAPVVAAALAPPEYHLAAGPAGGWQVNDHRGVEQGFTLDVAPAGDPGAPLVVELVADANRIKAVLGC